MTRGATWAAYVALPTVVLFFTGVGLLVNGDALRPATDFALPIEAGDGASDGDRVSLHHLRGRVVLLDFWASWCNPCRQSIPILNRARADFSGEPVTILGVNVEPELSLLELRAAHQAFGAEFPSVRDPSGALQHGYSVSSLPTLVIIDAEGQVHHTGVGVPEIGALRAQIAELLERRPMLAD